MRRAASSATRKQSLFACLPACLLGSWRPRCLRLPRLAPALPPTLLRPPAPTHAAGARGEGGAPPACSCGRDYECHLPQQPGPGRVGAEEWGVPCGEVGGMPGTCKPVQKAPALCSRTMETACPAASSPVVTCRRRAPLHARPQHLALPVPLHTQPHYCARPVTPITLRTPRHNHPLSMHPHGVKYGKDSEGAPYKDGTGSDPTLRDCLDDAVLPGPRTSSRGRWGPLQRVRMALD